MVFMRAGVVIGLCAVCNGNDQMTQRWWEHGSSMRTISPHCNNMTFAELLASVDDVHASGTSIFSMNAAYDSGFGYDYSGLWCGLAASELKQVSRAIGSQTAWEELEQKVHSNNMSLVTWMNPSYFWTGSPHFKAAEQDIKQYGVNSSAIPASSPALWFRWRTDNIDNVFKPSDSLDWTGDPPPTNGDKGWVWVWSPEANASYLSVWGHQPTTDWLSSQWQAYFRTVVSFWIDEMNLDGFVFDFPDGYIGSGSSNSHLQDSRGESLWEYNPDIIKQYITDVIHDVGDYRVAAFAELYPDFRSVDRGNAYGFDSIISDDGGNSGFRTVAAAVQEGNARSVDARGNAKSVDSAFTGQGGPDALRSQCFRSNGGDCALPWTRFVVGTSWLENADLIENNYDCRSNTSLVESVGVVSLEECFEACAADERCEAITVGWNARSSIVEVDCSKLHDVEIRSCITTRKTCEACPFAHSTFAVNASVKTRQAMAITIAGGNLLAVEQGADGAWWSNNDWPGRWDPVLANLQGTFQHNAAFNRQSLRVELPVLGSGHYAMLRYDHIGTGLAAVVVFNLESKTSSVKVDLSALSRVYGHRPTNLLTGETTAALESSYPIEIPAHDMVVLGFEGLGTWTQHRNTTCTYGWGPSSSSLDGCLLECLGKDFCHGVSVQWTSTSRDMVSCQMLDTETKLSDCQTADVDHSAFFLSSLGAPDLVV